MTPERRAELQAMVERAIARGDQRVFPSLDVGDLSSMLEAIDPALTLDGRARIPGITKDLLIALVLKNGGEVTLSVAEVDAVGNVALGINGDQIAKTLTLKAAPL
jgi:hypothetical protein